MNWKISLHSASSKQALKVSYWNGPPYINLLPIRVYGSDYRTIDNSRCFQDRFLSFAMLMMNAVGGLQMRVRGWWDVEFRLDEPLMLCCSKTLMVWQNVHQSCGVAEVHLSSHTVEFCSEHTKINQSVKQSAGFSLVCSTIHCLWNQTLIFIFLNVPSDGSAMWSRWPWIEV